MSKLFLLRAVGEGEVGGVDGEVLEDAGEGEVEGLYEEVFMSLRVLMNNIFIAWLNAHG